MDIQLCSFAPIIGTQPKVLILGTMPSATSLQQNEYYAYPGNVFWKIISAIKEIECPTDYKEKKELILEMNLALWDVCHTCIRPGSADSDIQNEEPNELKELLEAHPSIRTILFNGKMAEKLFHKHLKLIDGVEMKVMPSTSPAYTLSFEKKLKLWKELLISHLDSPI